MGLEETQISDPKTGKSIRISTTCRKVYRKLFAGSDLDYSHTRNIELNEVIAKDFAGSASKVIHYFKLGKPGDTDRTWAEIRNRSAGGRGTFMFFISAIRGEYIDVLVLQNAYRPPRYKKTNIEDDE